MTARNRSNQNSVSERMSKARTRIGMPLIRGQGSSMSNDARENRCSRARKSARLWRISRDVPARRQCPTCLSLRYARALRTCQKMARGSEGSRTRWITAGYLLDHGTRVRPCRHGSRTLGNAGRSACAELTRLKRDRRCIFLGDPIGAEHLPSWVLKSDQTTDGHLLQLASAYGAALATLDKGIPGALLIPEVPCDANRVSEPRF